MTSYDSDASFGWVKVSRKYRRFHKINLTADMSTINNGTIFSHSSGSSNDTDLESILTESKKSTLKLKKIKRESKANKVSDSSDDEQLTVSNKIRKKQKKINKQLNFSIKQEIVTELESDIDNDLRSHKVNKKFETSDSNFRSNNGTSPHILKRLNKSKELDFNKSKISSNNEIRKSVDESDDSDENNHQYSFQTNNSLNLSNGLKNTTNTSDDSDSAENSKLELLNTSKKQIDSESNNNSKRISSINVKKGLQKNKEISEKKLPRGISESPKKKNGVSSVTTNEHRLENKTPKYSKAVPSKVNNVEENDNKTFNTSTEIITNYENNNSPKKSVTNIFRNEIHSEKINAYLSTNNTLNDKNITKFPKINNITSDEEVWIVQCPKDIDTNLLMDQNIFDSKYHIQYDKKYLQCSATANDNVEKSNAVMFKTNAGFNVMSLPITGNIIIKENVQELNEIKVSIPIKTHVPFPSNLIKRHALLGGDYKEKLNISNTIRSRFVNVKKEKREKSRTKISKKDTSDCVKLKIGEKRKRKQLDVSNDKNDEPSPKKSKHANQMWTTEDAIERNLFCMAETEGIVVKKEKKRRSLKVA